ncbi:hypothetical protein PQX77_009675 [Marasmius sp. AFHP31]|nr:hypothetical protein PQX77_009675 [Marasmius sp. AFHP31]
MEPATSGFLAQLYAFASSPNPDDLDTTHSAFTFRLSEKEGALLMLPHGSTIQNLMYTAEFTKRIRDYWPHWSNFANEKVDLMDTGQSLCLVTGVHRCSAWAMATWDSNLGVESDLLQLGMGRTDQVYTWRFPPARCSTQSKGSHTTDNSQSDPKETIFIRGFWIDFREGQTSWQPPVQRLGPGKDMDGNGGGNPKTGGGSQDPPSAGGFTSNSSSSAQRSYPGGSHSGGSDPTSASDTLEPPMDGRHIMTLDLSALGEDNSGVITHPCKVTNKYTLELISWFKPALLETGCVAFSHDNDWINIIEQSDEEIPSEPEVVKRICSQFKFVLEGDAVYTETMTDSDRELLNQREVSLGLQSLDGVFPVLLELREDENTAGDHPTGGSLTPSDTTPEPVPRRASSRGRLKGLNRPTRANSKAHKATDTGVLWPLLAATQSGWVNLSGPS